MKLPLFIKTMQQLRKILRLGDIESQASWDGRGPCPEFVHSDAVEFVVQGQSYIVFMNRQVLERFYQDLKTKDNARKQKGVTCRVKTQKTGSIVTS